MTRLAAETPAQPLPSTEPDQDWCSCGSPRSLGEIGEPFQLFARKPQPMAALRLAPMEYSARKARERSSMRPQSRASMLAIRPSSSARGDELVRHRIIVLTGLTAARLFEKGSGEVVPVESVSGQHALDGGDSRRARRRMTTPSGATASSAWRAFAWELAAGSIPGSALRLPWPPGACACDRRSWRALPFGAHEAVRVQIGQMFFQNCDHLTERDYVGGPFFGMANYRSSHQLKIADQAMHLITVAKRGDSALGLGSWRLGFGSRRDHFWAAEQIELTDSP